MKPTLSEIVLALRAAGLSDKEIEKELGASPNFQSRQLEGEDAHAFAMRMIRERQQRRLVRKKRHSQIQISKRR